MSKQTIYARPLKMMMLGFLGFTLAAAGLAFAQKMGFIDAPLEKRAMGLILGAVIVVTGNFLPKTRPLTAPGVNPPGAAAAAERFAGWTLFVVGIAYIALFAFAPLDQARKISAILGIAAMVYVAASWAWMLRGALLGGQDEMLTEKDRVAEKRKVIMPLLFAFFYVLATSSMVFLLHDRSQIEKAGWWMFLGFWLLYAALMMVLGRKRCAD